MIAQKFWTSWKRDRAQLNAHAEGKRPAELRRSTKWRSPARPAIVLGRLAVDTDHRAKGIGKHLLREAMQRSLEVATVHAIDDEAISFYVPFGLRRFPTDSRTLFLAIETIAKSL